MLIKKHLLFYAILLFSYRKYLTSKKEKEKNKKEDNYEKRDKNTNNSCRNISTKYYAEPQRAFEKEYTPSAVTEPIEIKNDIYLYDIDENNAIYFAMTKSGDLLASDMHKKNGKYFSLGNYALYDLNDLTETFSTGAKEQKLYGNNGKFTTTCKWKVTIDENSEENNERIKIYDYKIEGVEYHLYLIILK